MSVYRNHYHPAVKLIYDELYSTRAPTIEDVATQDVITYDQLKTLSVHELHELRRQLLEQLEAGTLERTL